MDDQPSFRPARGGGAALPIEPVRHRYLTILGGLSPDLQPWEVGIRSEALHRNTDLVPFRDRVTVAPGDEASGRPLLTRDLFTIVALDAARPGALALSPHGEAVLSTLAFDPRRDDHPLAGVPEGARLVLNATLSRRWRGPPDGWVADVLRAAVRDRTRS